MKRKQGGFFGFTGIRLVDFLVAAMGFLVLAILATAIWAIWGPDENSEAASKKLFEDMASKIRRLEDGNSVIVDGSLDKDIWLVSFDSNYFPKKPDSDKLRPTACGSRSNSCICLCRDERCTKTVKDMCKGFLQSQINDIQDMSIQGPKNFVRKFTLDKQFLSYGMPEELWQVGIPQQK